MPTDPAEARQRLAETEARLAAMEAEHRQLRRAAGRWPRRWLQVRWGVVRACMRGCGRSLCFCARAPVLLRARFARAAVNANIINANNNNNNTRIDDTTTKRMQAGCAALFAQLVGFGYLTWWVCTARCVLACVDACFVCVCV